MVCMNGLWRWLLPCELAAISVSPAMTEFQPSVAERLPPDWTSSIGIRRIDNGMAVPFVGVMSLRGRWH